MQVELETTGALERRMKVQVPAAHIEAEVEKRLKSMGRRSKLKGFRPGKVPMKVLQQQYGDDVRREVLGDLMQRSYAEALAQENLNPAAAPHIEPLSTEAGADLEYTATFEIYPEVELKGLDALKIERPAAEVSDADVDRMVENLRRQHASWEPVERAAAEGDSLRIDFSGERDGEPVEGTSAEDQRVELGAGRVIPDFESNLIGASAGDERTFDATFPEDYHEPSMQGTVVTFSVKVHEVLERKLPEVDAEFLKALGVDDGDEARMRSEVRESMERERDQTVRRVLKDRALDAVLEANPIELPNSLVDEEIEGLQSQSMARSGQDPKSIEGRPDRELFEPAARRRVSLGLIVGEIIRSENLVLDRDRLDARLREMSEEYQDPEAIVRAMRSDRETMQRMELMVLEEQVLDHLLEVATVVDVDMPFTELMDFQG